MSPPAISNSKAVGASKLPSRIAKIALLDVFKTPSPKAKDGITLNTQDNYIPISRVSSMILRIKKTKGPRDPTKK